MLKQKFTKQKALDDILEALDINPITDLTFSQEQLCNIALERLEIQTIVNELQKGLET